MNRTTSDTPFDVTQNLLQKAILDWLVELDETPDAFVSLEEFEAFSLSKQARLYTEMIMLNIGRRKLYGDY